MAKRSSISRDSELEEKKSHEEMASILPDLWEEDTPTLVTLKWMRDGIKKVTGAVTEQVYVFSGAGSEVDVDERDAEVLLKRVIRKSCCGDLNDSPYFEVVR